MMLLTLEKYFLEHGQLVIPTYGQLSLNQKEAFYMEGQFHPPVESVNFESLDGIKPSKLFYIYLSDHLDCTIEQAIIDYDAFFNDQINHNKSIDLGNLGHFSITNDTLSFHSNFISANYYSPISIEKVLTEDQVENNFNETPKRWWIWPLLITILAILAILLK